MAIDNKIQNELEELRGQLEVYENTMNNQKENLSEYKKELEDVENEKFSLKRTNDEISYKNQELSNDLNSSNNRLEKLLEQNEQLKEELDKEHKFIKEKESDFRLALKEKVDEIENIYEEMRELNFKLITAEDNKNEVIQDYHKLEEKFIEMEEENKELKLRMEGTTIIREVNEDDENPPIFQESTIFEEGMNFDSFDKPDKKDKKEKFEKAEKSDKLENFPNPFAFQINEASKIDNMEGNSESEIFMNLNEKVEEKKRFSKLLQRKMTLQKSQSNASKEYNEEEKDTVSNNILCELITPSSVHENMQGFPRKRESILFSLKSRCYFY